MFTFLLIDWVFFTLLAVSIIGITALLENEYIGWSHTLFVGVVVLVAYKMDYSFQELMNNPLIILKYLGIYLGLGIIWSFCKWYFFLKNVSADYQELKEITINQHGNLEPNMLQAKIYETYRSIYSYSDKTKLKIESGVNHTYNLIIPQAKEYKALITSWITHWPISLVWTLINDPIKKLINHIFSYIQGIFQQMSNAIFKSAMKDFEKTESSEVVAQTPAKAGKR